jgi:integrase/recombinase XerD
MRLRSFLRFCGDIDLHRITAQQVSAFLNRSRILPNTRSMKLGTLNGFFEYWATRSKLKRIPVPPRIHQPPDTFVPYIYSRSELRALLDAVPQCQRLSACSMSGATFRTLLLFLYGTGMRVSEALGLRLMDVDLKLSVVTIRNTKFYKSRLVPLGPGVQKLIKQHLQLPGHKNQPSQPLFQTKKHHAIPIGIVDLSFARLRSLVGISRDAKSSCQPRLHALRHTFAVHRLTAGYRRNEDVQRLIPALSTYLGHRDLNGTQRYLTMTPELLTEANRSFERYASGGANDR